MNKEGMIAYVAKETGLTKKDSKLAIDAIFNGIKDSLTNGKKVQLIGFGSFLVRSRAARKGRNPHTGAELTIPAGVVPAFKPGKQLKLAVKKGE
ncbi:HU family DNA-binding protein [Limosilactobacillus reuteri]|uniref:HU family DNA-binding protein n=1 Tax=Limosilactobacillus reuteri TaxID=1598 RepID=UPI003969D561